MIANWTAAARLRLVLTLTLCCVLTGLIESADAARLTTALYHKDGKLQANLSKFNRQVADQPENGVAWRDLGVTQARLGMFDEAIVALDKAYAILPEDEYLLSYRALSLEMLGRHEESAQVWELAAAQLEGENEVLLARAALVRAQGRITMPDGDGIAIALLPPVDLSGEHPELVDAVALSLVSGLNAAEGVVGLRPDQTAEQLGADEARASDFDDPQRRNRAGRILDRNGVEAVLTSSFFVMEGVAQYRLALFEVSADGCGEPFAPALDGGTAGEELLPLARALPEIWSRLGSGAPDSASESWMPTSLEGAKAYAQAVNQFRAGEFAAAAEGFTTAAGLLPQVAELASWRDGLALVLPMADEPLAVGVGDLSSTAEMLRRHAQNAYDEENEEDF